MVELLSQVSITMVFGTNPSDLLRSESVFDTDASVLAAATAGRSPTKEQVAPTPQITAEDGIGKGPPQL